MKFVGEIQEMYLKEVIIEAETQKEAQEKLIRLYNEEIIKMEHADLFHQELKAQDYGDEEIEVSYKYCETY